MHLLELDGQPLPVGPAGVRRISGPLLDRADLRSDDIHMDVPRAAMQQLHMSARAYHRILKLARTIADLADSGNIETAHLAEAIQYRPRRQT